MQIESTVGLNENTPYCLRFDVEDLANGRVGIANNGFWGIGAEKKANLTIVSLRRHATAATMKIIYFHRISFLLLLSNNMTRSQVEAVMHLRGRASPVFCPRCSLQ